MRAIIRSMALAGLVCGYVGMASAQTPRGQRGDDPNAQERDRGAQRQDQQDRQQRDKARQQQSQQNWQRIVQQMQGEGISLAEAIEKAANEVDGHAIAARVQARKSMQRRMGRGETGEQRAAAYTIEVLCRTKDGKFKVATINGRSGDVMGVASASPRGERLARRGERGQRGAQNQWDERERQMRGDRKSWPMDDGDLEVFRVVRFNSLEDTNVKNDGGKDLGHIADVAIAPQSGRVLYGALSFGGVLGVGDKLFAVPLQALEYAGGDVITFDVREDELKDAKGFNQDNWPRRADARWMQGATGDREEYELVGHEEREQRGERDRQRDRAARTVLQGDNVMGMKVTDRAGEELGTVEDLYIDMDRAQVAYVVLSHGGWLGMGDKLFAVPWRALDVRTADDGDGHKLVLDMSRSKLKSAPGSAKAEDDVWNDPDWAVRVYDFYEVEPYWEKAND